VTETGPATASGDAVPPPTPRAGEGRAPGRSADGAHGGRARPGRPPSTERSRTRAGEVAQRAADDLRAALRPFTLPNGITLLRFALVPFFVLAVIGENHRLALVLFVLGGLSDSLDGALARALGARSRLGAYLDPIADKVLLVTAYVALTWPPAGAVHIPVWLTVMALSRDVLIVLVALLLYLGADIVEFPPSVWGKLTTFMHIVTVGLVLVANITEVSEAALLACFYAALALTIVSGVDYVRRAAVLVETEHGRGRG
jgi:cardiolipin synthase (CMP-forming)